MDSENSTRDDGTNNQPITENESPTSNIDHTVKNSPESELNTQTKFESQTNAVNSNVSDYECSNVDNNQTENTVPPLGASHEETKSGVESMDVVNLQCDQVLSNTDVNTNENPSIISPPETITDESIKKVPDNTEQNLSSIQVSKLNQLVEANSETSVNKSNLNTESNFHPGHPQLSNLPSDTDKIDCKTKDSSNENNVLTIFDTSNTNLDQKEINAVESNDKTCLMDKSNNPSDSTKIICESETMLVDTNIHDVENHISTYPTTDVSSEKADAMEVDGGASLSNTSVDSNEVNTSVENIATELVSPGVQLSINDTVDVKQIPDEPNSCKQDNNYETIKSNVADLNLPEDPSMSKAWDPEETDKINEIKIPIPEKYAVHEETIKSDVNEAPKSPSLKSIENSEIKEHENIPEEDTLQNDPNQCTNDAKNSAEVPKINSFENSETVSDHKEQNITHTKTIDGEEKTKEHIIEPISVNQIESSVELSTLDTKEQESVDSDEEESVDSKKNKHVKEIENVDLKDKESVYSEEKKESDLKVKESVDSSKNISVDLKEKDSVHSIEKESVDPIEKESVDSSENISADLKEKDSVHSIEKESVDSSENISVHLKEKDSVHSIAKESVDSSENISVDLKEKDSDHSIEKEIVDSNEKERIDSKETQSVDANESKSVLSKEIEHSVLKEEESTVSKEKVSVDSSENESVDLKENESDDSKKNDSVDLKEKESVDSNETDVSKNKESLDCKEKEMIDPTETESLDSKEKDSIEPSSETSPNEEIVSENSADPAAHSVELLLEKNKGKENAIVLEENIEVSGENVSNKIGDLEILPEAGRNKSDKILSSNNKNGDSKTQIKVETKTILDSVSEISKIEIVENSDKNKGNLPGDEEMSRRLKNKEGNKDSMTKIDDTVIYKKFECKPLTIRADINMEEFQKLKSAPDILSEPSVPMKTHDENIKDKEELIKSSEVDLETVDGEKPKKTRSTAKSLEKPIERLKSKPKKIITASTSKTKDKEEIPNIKDKEEVPKKNKDKNEVPKKIKDKEEVSKRVKEKEEISRKNKEKESQKKTQENIVESPVEEDKPKIKCKKLDIQETKKDTREPSKRLIIKTQSSINESVQSTKKSSQADAVDLEVVDEKYTKNPMRMYEVCKELRKMVRSQMSKKDSKVAALKSQYQLEELTLENIGKIDIIPKSCDSCKLMKLPAYKIVESFKTHLFCSMVCGIRFKLRRMDLIPAQVKRICCGHCNKIVVPDEKSLSWKTNNYCDDKCLSKAFQMLGDTCGNCNTHIPIKLRGRYILQRGNIKAIFCSSMCRAYHKSAFKYCTICNKISDGARMTTVNKYKICSQECLRKFTSYKKTQGNMACCTVCHINKPIQYNVLSPGEPVHHLCSEKCFKAFNFVNKLDVVQCNLCERYFDKVRQEDTIFCFFSDLFHNFCSRFCHYIYMREARGKKTCAWCKGEKNEPSMVRRVYEDQEYFYCTVTCLNMLNVEKSVTAKAKQCDYCKSYSTDTFYVSSYSATSSFCTYKCVYNFHNNFPCTKPLQNSSNLSKIVISDVRSLNAANAFQPPAPKPIAPKPPVRVVPNKIIKPKYEVTKILPRIIRQILVKPQEKKDMKNAATQVHPTTSTKRVSCKTTSVTKDCQTGEDMGRPSLIPVPVPLYVPSPAAMYSAPFPVLVPIPIPVPVPIFIPTTRNSAAGIFKEIKRIQEKIPADPFEAELLMMAEMVASDKKDEGGTTDDDSNAAEDEFDNEGGTMESSNNAFGEDVLQMAIKMACNDLEPSGALQGVDLDDALQPATITITQTAPRSDNNAEDIDAHDAMFRGANRGGRKRGTSSKAPISRAPPMKRQRRTSDIIPTPPAAAPAPPPPMELEKPDANMCLKYTFGVNAWRQWVVEKNQELEKAATAAAGNRKPTNIKLFKPEILQLTADELNFSLCLFVQEVRKPNGTQYAPDTIYYLCLGIQQYLFESGRIDNIFTDPYYEKFTEALDEVCCKFSALYNDTQFIVTRVEEEHLWESKQLGAHSPHVLLNTLMFFNTKHFNLITVEEHMQLSFSHIMKHWKRNPSMAANIATNCTKAPPGSRNVLLRFYPPQSAIDAPGSRKKKVYEQQENEENPLRCPVRLYEFYLSKCPESVKTRNDVFYLLPERSCVPDSPVWYSTTPLNKEALMKMLHRIKMVKEINIAFLSL